MDPSTSGLHENKCRCRHIKELEQGISFGGGKGLLGQVHWGFGCGKAPFRCEFFWLLTTVALSFVFDKNYSIMDYLGLKDSSHDFSAKRFPSTLTLAKGPFSSDFF